jgi:hypothetical protein
MEAVATSPFFRRKVNSLIPSLEEELKRQKKEEQLKISADEKKANKDEKRFDSIREKLIANALSALKIEPEMFKEYSERMKFLLSQNDNETSKKSVGEILNDSKNVAQGAEIAVKAGDRATAKEAISATLSIASSLGIPIVSQICSLIQLTFTSILAGMSIKKRLKNRKNDISDFSQKSDAFDENLKKFMPKFQEFVNSLESDKQMLLDKSKSMKKKEFQAFIKEYVDNKIKACGLDNIFDEETAEKAAANVEKETPEQQDENEIETSQSSDEENKNAENKENNNKEDEKNKNKKLNEVQMGD